jgi:hypothetical protein
MMTSHAYTPSADAVARAIEAGGCPTDDSSYDRKTNTYAVMVKRADLPKLQFNKHIQDFISMELEGNRVTVTFSWK